MIQPEQLQQDIAALPEAAQVLVADFVAFLKQRYTPAAPTPTAPIPTDQPFIGMWKGRAETQDSVAWVRQTREAQWHE